MSPFLPKEKRISAASDLTVSATLRATDILPDSQSHYLKLCERTLSFRGFPCGKRVRWLCWSRLTDLAQPQNFNYAEKCQELNFLRTSCATSAVRRRNCLLSRAFARVRVRMPERNLRRMAWVSCPCEAAIQT